jgi:hypothetical protein
VIKPSSEGFGNILNMRLDITEQFLVCIFSDNRVVVYSTKTG